MNRTLEGEIPPEIKEFSPELLVQWNGYKRTHPIGTIVKGTVVSRDVYGCYIDLGVPFRALLLVPYFKPEGSKQFPEDYPKLEEELDLKIEKYSDDKGAEIGTIGLSVLG